MVRINTLNSLRCRNGRHLVSEISKVTSIYFQNTRFDDDDELISSGIGETQSCASENVPVVSEKMRKLRIPVNFIVQDESSIS